MGIILLSACGGGGTGSTGSTTGGGDVAPTSPAETPITISFAAGDAIMTGSIGSASASISKATTSSDCSDITVYAINTMNALNNAGDSLYTATLVGCDFYVAIPTDETYAVVFQQGTSKAFYTNSSLDLMSVPISVDGATGAGTFDVESETSTSISPNKGGIIEALIGAAEVFIGADIAINVESARAVSSQSAQDFFDYTNYNPALQFASIYDKWLSSFSSYVGDINENSIADGAENINNWLEVHIKVATSETVPDLLDTGADITLFYNNGFANYFQSNYPPIMAETYAYLTTNRDLHSSLPANIPVESEEKSPTQYVFSWNGVTDVDLFPPDDTNYTIEVGDYTLEFPHVTAGVNTVDQVGVFPIGKLITSAGKVTQFVMTWGYNDNGTVRTLTAAEIDANVDFNRPGQTAYTWIYIGDHFAGNFHEDRTAASATYTFTTPVEVNTIDYIEVDYYLKPSGIR
ncbi:hypothetical protein KKA47_00690, partial [bacterium]|nr:hypothetical protein [bacterium]